MDGRGFFIAFEGGEGAGKSTYARALADAMRARGHDVILTREPGGTPIGEQIRSVLLGNGSTGMSPRTEALLFAAARAEHAAKVVRPGRDRGSVVITDRYIDSSITYQGVGRGLGTSQVAKLSLWATEDLLPDLTVVLDVPPSLGLARAGDCNRMEAESSTFHDRVREAFLELAQGAPHRYLVVDAAGPQSQVSLKVVAAVLARIDGWDLR